MKQESEVPEGGLSEDFRRRVDQWERASLFDQMARKIDEVLDEVETRGDAK